MAYRGVVGGPRNMVASTTSESKNHISCVLTVCMLAGEIDPGRPKYYEQDRGMRLTHSFLQSR